MADANFRWWADQCPRFVTSWKSANGALGAQGPLLTRSGKGVADLETLKIRLDDAITAVTSAESEATIDRARRDAGKINIRTDFSAWKSAAEFHLADSPYLAKLPQLPSLNMGRDEFLRPLDLAVIEWGKMDVATDVEGFTPPLLTRDGLALAVFKTRVAELRELFDDVPDEKYDASLERSRRDKVVGEVHNLCVAYLQAVNNALAPDDAVIENLPLLSPPSGRTPDAVVVTESFNPSTGLSELNWTASTDPLLARYSVRISAGPRYKSEQQATIGDVTPPVTTFTVPAIYTPSGATVWAKVFVVLSDGRVHGSEAVKIAG